MSKEIISIEDEITNKMISLYETYGHFARLDNAEVEKAHKKWLTLKSIRDKIKTAKETIEEEVKKIKEEIKKYELIIIEEEQKQMRVKDIIEKYNNEYADFEIYEVENEKAGKLFHSDNLKNELSSTLTQDYFYNLEVLDYELMDEEEYNNTILANTCSTADFSEYYGNKDAKVLVILVKDSN